MPKPGPDIKKELTDLEILNDILRNGTTKIEGCLREAETILKLLNRATKNYRKKVGL